MGRDDWKKGIRSYGFMSKSFLLFRGILMPLKWLVRWRDNIFKKVHMPTTSSASDSLEIGINFT